METFQIGTETNDSLLETLEYLGWYPSRHISMRDIFLNCPKKKCCKLAECLSQCLSSGKCLRNVGAEMRPLVVWVKEQFQ